MAIVLFLVKEEVPQVATMIRRWEMYKPCSDLAPYANNMDFVFYHNEDVIFLNHTTKR